MTQFLLFRFKFINIMKRILLKLSGESLQGKENYGICIRQTEQYVEDIIEIAKQEIQVAIVIGGGNIFRGISGSQKGFDRVKGDQMGMLATVINSIALQTVFEQKQIKAKVYTSSPMTMFGEYYVRDNVVQYMENGGIAILSGGTGNPMFSTDSASALRAIEIKADALLKGTRVNGVYTADPEKDKTATKYTTLTFDEAYQKKLKIMDLTAFTLCKENNMPILVFDMNGRGNLAKVIKNQTLGTLITR